MTTKPALKFRAGASVAFTDGDGNAQHGVIDHIEPPLLVEGIVRYAIQYTTEDGPCIVLREGHELRGES